MIDQAISSRSDASVLANAESRPATRRRTALITGASSGIGEAFADVFAANGFDLVVTARRKDRLFAIAERVSRERGVSVDVIAMDLMSPGGVVALVGEIAHRRIAIDALVNCAGFGVPGRFTEVQWPLHADMLHLTIAVPSELMHRLIPGMIERRYGRIANVASLAGLVDSGAGALYSAAKRYLIELSLLLTRELSPYDIRITAICPGLTRTEFHANPGMGASVAGMPDWMWMEAGKVAREGFDAVMKGRRVVVTGRMNRILSALLRYVPRRLVVSSGRLLVRAYRRVRR